jgi:hypothetical protein
MGLGASEDPKINEMNPILSNLEVVSAFPEAQLHFCDVWRTALSAHQAFVTFKYRALP